MEDEQSLCFASWKRAGPKNDLINGKQVVI